MTNGTLYKSHLLKIDNTLVVLRDDEELPFEIDNDGNWIATIKNYAIIPREEYDRLLRIEFRMEGLDK